jgi:hypothetical protein
MAAEIPTSEWVERLGPAPDIYSPEIKSSMRCLANLRRRLPTLRYCSCGESR